MKKLAVRTISFLLAMVMLAVSGIGELEVKAEGIQQEPIELIEESKEEIESGMPEGGMPENPELEEPADSKEQSPGNPDSETPEEPVIKQEQFIELVEQKEELTLYVKDEFVLEAVLTGDGMLTYESSDPEVVEVDETGLLKAISEGEAEIIIRADETENYLAAELVVSVKVSKKNQKLKGKNMEFVFGEEAKQVVFDNPLNSVPVFEMENPEIAEVDEAGYVTPLKTGKTVLKITVPGNDVFHDAEIKVNIVVKTSLAKPELLKAAGNGSKITISWKKVAGAEGYYLYEKSGSKYVLLATIKKPGTLSYTRTKVSSGKLYTYYVIAFAGGGKNISDKSNTKSGKYLLAPSLEVKAKQSAVNLKWSEVTGASGYYIYRRTKTSESWKNVAKITSVTNVAWTDKSAGNGKTNYYLVKAYYSDSRGSASPTKSTYYLTSPSIKSATKKSKSTKMTVKWTRNKSAAGYQIQYADNPFFYKPKTVTIKKNSTVSKQISKLSKSKKYYVRVRAYKKVSGKNKYSDWSLSSNVKSTKTVSTVIQKYKKKTFELKGKAKQKLGGYDTVQGGCTDGKYAYYVLYNRKVEKCKVVKVNLSGMKVEKVSGVLSIAHGNDMTYNSQTKRLIVTHTNVNAKRISIINPSSLKIEKSFDVSIPKKMSGVSDKELKKANGFCGIAYNAKKKQYAALMKNTGDVMILNSSFVPVSYVKLSKKSTLTKQGIDVTDDYILISYSGYPNIIMVYTWDGQYVSKINVKKGYEIENIYHIGKQYYATFYASAYKNGKLTKRDNYVYKLKGL